MREIVLSVFLLFSIFLNLAYAGLNEEDMAKLIVPPMQLGTKDEALPIWRVLDGGGAHMGYVFESRDLAPIPGFSGTPMNLLVLIDKEGTFLDVSILDHNEPVFVSGLGERPFFNFLQQYEGLSLANNIKVGTAEDRSASAVSANVQIDGVLKATASVRIANESILASALKVARAKLKGVAPKPAAYPRKDLFEKLNWEQLVERGLVKHIQLKNTDVEKMFDGSEFAGEDEIAISEPDEIYTDIWVADLGLPSVGKNLLSEENQIDLRNQLTPFEEPVLVLERGRHPLLSEDFVRNTVPDRLSVMQNGFPISIRDADIEVELNEQVPDIDQAMILRIDTRLGFDPASPWTFIAKTVRTRGSFMPAVGHRDLTINVTYPAEYFDQPEEVDDGPPWLKSWQDQQTNLICLVVFLSVLLVLLWRYQFLMGRLKYVRPFLLIITLFFIGWYAQGQLSIVTVLGFFKAVANGQSLTYMLYDPFSLVIWGISLSALFIWGRGTFCGWLCPYGVLQEFSYKLAKLLKLPEYRVSDHLNGILIYVKYVVLAALFLFAFIAPNLSDVLVEVEPFKTAITMQFERSWGYVGYAGFWIVLSMFLFKGFCRFICPLGAFFSVLGFVRLVKWLPRRQECGSPCQLCQVKCEYQAISRGDGSINYSECFQCLDCVEIYEDDKQCVPLILANKKKAKAI